MWFEEKKVPDELLNRFSMNRKLIDLRMIPQNIKDAIDETLAQRINKKVTMQDLLKYFRANDLNEMTTLIGDFF